VYTYISSNSGTLLKKLSKMGLISKVAETAINTGLGLALEGHNDRRQLRQQGKLGEQQLGLNKQQMKYGKQLDLQMWKDTNYPAQLEQMKAAGLSPGLMYGMSGGGGATVGGGGGSVSAPNAPQGGNEVLGLQLLGAQKELLEAQTEKTKAETTKTSGVDTKLTQELGETEEIKNQMMKDTYEETFSKIRAEAERAEEEWRKAAAEGKVAEATADMEIEKVKADLAGIGITNELRKSQKNLTDAEITETVNRVAQRWEEIGVQKGRLELEKWVRDVADSTKLAVETVSRIATTVLGRGEKGVETPKMERGWSERHGEWWKTKE